MHVDTHVHVISPDRERYPLDPSGVTGSWYEEHPCAVEELLALMDGAGVDRAVLVQPVSAYRHDNRYCADAARRHADRCTSVGCVDLTAPSAVEAARDVVEREGMRGVRWFALRGEGLHEPRALWDEIERLRVPAVVTILADRLEELAAVLPGIAAVPVALDHCGFADFSNGVPDDLRVLARHPNLHLKVSSNALDLMAEHGDAADAVAELAAIMGADRLMWGSDFSQTHDRPYGDLVEWGRAAAARLDDDDRAAFLGGTALRLWPELAR